MLDRLTNRNRVIVYYVLSLNTQRSICCGTSTNAGTIWELRHHCRALSPQIWICLGGPSGSRERESSEMKTEGSRSESNIPEQFNRGHSSGPKVLKAPGSMCWAECARSPMQLVQSKQGEKRRGGGKGGEDRPAAALAGWSIGFALR